MPFVCPGCGETVHASPDRWGLRCPACRRVLRTRALEASGPPDQDRVLVPPYGERGPERLYDVEVAGQPATRRRVAVAWTADESRRLRVWLAWSTVLTLGLVAVLYAFARWG